MIKKNEKKYMKVLTNDRKNNKIMLQSEKGQSRRNSVTQN